MTALDREDILFCGDLTSAAALAKEFGIPAKTIRERLRRDGKVVRGTSPRIYECDERIVRPRQRVSPPRPRSTTFDVTRYMPNIDGAEVSLHVARYSQEHLRKPIGTTEWVTHTQIGANHWLR